MEAQTTQQDAEDEQDADIVGRQALFGQLAQTQEIEQAAMKEAEALRKEALEVKKQLARIKEQKRLQEAKVQQEERVKKAEQAKAQAAANRRVAEEDLKRQKALLAKELETLKKSSEPEQSKPMAQQDDRLVRIPQKLVTSPPLAKRRQTATHEEGESPKETSAAPKRDA